MRADFPDYSSRYGVRHTASRTTHEKDKFRHPHIPPPPLPLFFLLFQQCQSHSRRGAEREPEGQREHNLNIWFETIDIYISGELWLLVIIQIVSAWTYNFVQYSHVQFTLYFFFKLMYNLQTVPATSYILVTLTKVYLSAICFMLYLLCFSSE